MADSRAKRRKVEDGKAPASAWIPFVVACAALIGAGFLPAPGAYNTVYVLLPYVVAVVSAALCGFGLIGDEARSARAMERGKRGLVPPIKVSSLLGLVTSVMTAVGEILHAVAYGLVLSMEAAVIEGAAVRSHVWGIVGYVVLMVCAAAAFWYIWKQTR